MPMVAHSTYLFLRGKSLCFFSGSHLITPIMVMVVVAGSVLAIMVSVLLNTPDLPFSLYPPLMTPDFPGRTGVFGHFAKVQSQAFFAVVFKFKIIPNGVITWFYYPEIVVHFFKTNVGLCLCA